MRKLMEAVKPLFESDYEEYYDEITPTVMNAWKSVYPNIELNVFDNEDAWMPFSTADKYESTGGNGEDFYFSIAAQYVVDEEPIGYINIGDAYANDYKGVITKIIAAVFSWLEQKHPDIVVRELGISYNRNEEAWRNIAKKVGAQIEKRGYYQ